MEDDEMAALDPITKLFEIELESTTSNTEAEAEPEKVTTEKVLKLSCHIDNNNNPINNIQFRKLRYCSAPDTQATRVVVISALCCI